MLDWQRLLADCSSMSTDREDSCPPRQLPPEIDNPSGDIECEYWRWCPRCGHELHNEKCKLICPRCHYFLSCSDFD